MGVPVGCIVNPLQEHDRFAFEQTEYEFATIYELPLNEVAVVVPAKMTVLKSGILVTDVAIMTPWDDWPLDLSDPDESSWWYADLIRGMYHSPPSVLNHWLNRGVSLRLRQVEGVMLAHGYVPVPAKCHDETLIKVTLLLHDERHEELDFDFGVRLDRNVKRKHERRQRERREFARSNKGGGLLQPAGGQPGQGSSVSQESGYACREDKVKTTDLRRKAEISDVRHRWHTGA